MPRNIFDSPEMIAEYLTEALETDDEVFIAKGDRHHSARAGMGAVADSAGVSRENLYARSVGNHPAGIRDNPQGAGSARRATGGEAACGLMHKPSPWLPTEPPITRNCGDSS